MSDHRRIALTISEEAYDRLLEVAQQELRTIDQQAKWILYKALGVRLLDHEPEQKTPKAKP